MNISLKLFLKSKTCYTLTIFRCLVGPTAVWRFSHRKWTQLMKSWDFSTLWLCTSLILWGTEYRSYSVEKCAVTVSFSHLIPGRMVICALRISNFGLLLFRPQVEQQNRAWEAANVTLRYGKNVRNIPSTCFTRPAVFDDCCMTFFTPEVNTTDEKLRF